ncbi:MAG: PQQ-dependent sugar dehydrogenase, partial [Pseudomonadota bacterium]
SAGMPGFNDVLSEESVDAVFAFIMDAQTTPPGVGNPLPEELSTRSYRLKVEKLVESGLEKPWGIAFVDDRRALITENSGGLYWMVDGALDPQPISGVPDVDLATSTGGLLDVAVDPDYAENGWIYLAYSHSEDPNEVEAPGMTRVLRARVEERQLVDVEQVFQPPERFQVGNSKHWGGRLLFDKNADLYFSIGDMSQPEASQDPAAPTGKVFRVRRDGAHPSDNPFQEQGDVASAVFSLGNRNVQGLAQHPETGAIWASEHGPHGGDELNVLEKGANYGWPIATYGVNYDGTEISPVSEMEGVTPPVREWTPALAVSAIDFVTGDGFPAWRNDLLMGSLSREELLRFSLDGETIVEEESLFKGYGRIRDVKIGPDGALYVLFNNPGMVVRFTALE